jgi:hypothetical protein
MFVDPKDRYLVTPKAYVWPIVMCLVHTFAMTRCGRLAKPWPSGTGRSHS